ncbi:MAG: hypothetical protein PHP62_02160 [Candidatus Moranbacteria bacterium]|nr:hypothetical protein [Candidatus Moranbacteria bacterium]
MENQPTTLDKVVKISIIMGALVVSLSIAYYLVIHIPQRDKAKTIQTMTRTEFNKKSLENCLNEEDARRNNSLQSLVELDKKLKTADLTLSFQNTEKDYQIRKADCFKKYPQ